MAALFLIIIYLSFISLGLPDSMLGAAWPVMQPYFGAPLESAGVISMIISFGTVLSSLFTVKLIKKLGTGKVTLISVFLTAASLLGFSFSQNVLLLFALAVPLGLGAGAVDSALNNYVALHYKASHMSWLHCCWGVGAMLGPVIMGGFLSRGGIWQNGYFTVGIIQLCLAAVLLLSLSMWKSESLHEEKTGGSILSALKVKGVPGALISFFFYCGVELNIGLWGSSFLVTAKGLTEADAASAVSLFFLGITLGRLISGFASYKISSKALIRIGQLTVLGGAVLIALPLSPVVSIIGIAVCGLGCAPIYPCMIHETPARFGKELSASVISLQMAGAYLGNVLMPPLFGFVASKIGISLYPYFAGVLILLSLLFCELLNRQTKKANG